MCLGSLIELNSIFKVPTPIGPKKRFAGVHKITRSIDVGILVGQQVLSPLFGPWQQGDNFFPDALRLRRPCSGSAQIDICAPYMLEYMCYPPAVRGI